VILDAALSVFVEEGYAEANIAHVVERSGMSVGSIYHHFGGKAELFLALWEEFDAVYTAVVAEAVTGARQAGETEPVELFVIGARASLDLARSGSRLTTLFCNLDGPPGFEALTRTNGNTWIMNNANLLGLTDSPVDRFRASMLTAAVAEGSRMVNALDDESEIEAMVTAVLDTVRKLAR
jgi:AcrR family transcriptional regulator